MPLLLCGGSGCGDGDGATCTDGVLIGEVVGVVEIWIEGGGERFIADWKERGGERFESIDRQ